VKYDKPFSEAYDLIYEIRDSKRNREEFAKKYRYFDGYHSDIIEIQPHEIAGFFKRWNELEKYIEPQPADIFGYATIFSLRDALDRAEAKRDGIKTQADKENDATKIFENQFCIVVEPKTEEASCKYGAGATWCVSATTSTNYWQKYIDDGYRILFILPKTKTMEKHAIAINTFILADNPDVEVFGADNHQVNTKQTFNMFGLTINDLNISEYDPEIWMKKIYSALDFMNSYEDKIRSEIDAGYTDHIRYPGDIGARGDDDLTDKMLSIINFGKKFEIQDKMKIDISSAFSKFPLHELAWFYHLNPTTLPDSRESIRSHELELNFDKILQSIAEGDYAWVENPLEVAASVQDISWSAYRYYRKFSDAEDRLEYYNEVFSKLSFLPRSGITSDDIKFLQDDCDWNAFRSVIQAHASSYMIGVPNPEQDNIKYSKNLIGSWKPLK